MEHSIIANVSSAAAGVLAGQAATNEAISAVSGATNQIENNQQFQQILKQHEKQLQMVSNQLQMVQEQLLTISKESDGLMGHFRNNIQACEQLVQSMVKWKDEQQDLSVVAEAGVQQQQQQQYQPLAPHNQVQAQQQQGQQQQAPQQQQQQPSQQEQQQIDLEELKLLQQLAETEDQKRELVANGELRLTGVITLQQSQLKTTIVKAANLLERGNLEALEEIFTYDGSRNRLVGVNGGYLANQKNAISTVFYAGIRKHRNVPAFVTKKNTKNGKNLTFAIDGESEQFAAAIDNLDQNFNNWIFKDRTLKGTQSTFKGFNFGVAAVVVNEQYVNDKIYTAYGNNGSITMRAHCTTEWYDWPARDVDPKHLTALVLLGATRAEITLGGLNAREKSRGWDFHEAEIKFGELLIFPGDFIANGKILVNNFDAAPWVRPTLLLLGHIPPIVQYLYICVFSYYCFLIWL